MGFSMESEAFVVDEIAAAAGAQWQLVVEKEAGITVIYLGEDDDLGWWQDECVRLFGVWPSVFEKGNFVAVRPEG